MFLTTLNTLSENTNDINFTNETTLFFYNLSKDYEEYKNEIFSSINEDTSIEVLNESFSGFINKIKSIIKSILQFFKDLFNKFKSIFTRESSYSYNIILPLNKKIDENIKKQVEVYIEGFHYTIYPDIPQEFVLNLICKDCIGIIYDNNHYTYDQKINQLQYKLEYMYNILVENNEVIPTFRSTLLKYNKLIYEDEYKDIVYKIFRDDEDQKRKILITNSNIKSIIEEVLNYKLDITDINKNKKTIENIYSKLIYDLVDVSDYGNLTKIDAYSDILNKIVVIENKLLNKMSGIYAVTFSMKMDALMERLKQNKTAIMMYNNAINKIK